MAEIQIYKILENYQGHLHLKENMQQNYHNHQINYLIIHYMKIKIII